MSLRSSTPWRRRSGTARSWSPVLEAVLTLGTVLALGGCGAGNASVSAHRPGHTGSTSTNATGTSATTTARAHARNGVCHAATAPKPRKPEHIPKPRLRLNPSLSYTATLHTNCGTIGIELAAAHAPRTAASFAYLVKRGFYNHLTFHRVVSGFVIQGGDPNGDGSGGPGYTIVERPPAGVRYTRGTVAMAKAATEPAGASGSQFFIVLGKHSGLPPQYALLGQVVTGWKTVMAISHTPTTPGADGEDSSPSAPIVIEKATLASR